MAKLCQHHVFGEKTRSLKIDREWMTEHIISNVCDRCKITAFEYDLLTNPGAAFRNRWGDMHFSHPRRTSGHEMTHEGKLWWQIVPHLKLKPVSTPNATSSSQTYELKIGD